MCNIAGYVGKRQAAPILLEMIKKQEGFAGGFYTGIATIHEGKMYYAKITGDTDTLIKNTDALSLPGTIGIAHSRSKSGGGDKWAHPFVALDGNDEPSVAYIANGAPGYFKEKRADRNLAIVEELINSGVKMLSRDTAETSIYQTLPDGTAVHMSDTMCQLAARRIFGGKRSDIALSEAFCEMPSEIVGLLISLTEEKSIAYSRINMPAMVAFAKHGAYIASTAFAFPEDAGRHTVLPAMSYGRIFKSRYTVAPMKNPPAPLTDYDPALVVRAYENVLEMLKEEHTFGDLAKSNALLYTGEGLNTSRPLTYEILLSLWRAGKIELTTKRLPGAREDLDAPKTYIKLI